MPQRAQGCWKEAVLTVPQKRGPGREEREESRQPSSLVSGSGQLEAFFIGQDVKQRSEFVVGGFEI